ncbi:C39 family peptidase (plasmid) [Deinococcus radiomollis]|uniref:C39 family peptidase n=1 Tax=Deinococcus radiomollis TaxID=468916 RepID=UPI0038919D3E
MRRFLALVVLLLGMGGAARTVVHPAHITPTPKYVTNAVLQGIPLVRQGYNQCGPASLQMVLAYWGLGMDQAAIGALTKPDPRAYMGTSAIGAFASSVGLASTTVRGASLNMVRAFLAQGIPVIALSFFNTPGAVPHWRVVSGFDDKQGVVFVHDPLAGYVAIRYADFDTLRFGLGNIIAVLYPATYSTRVRLALSS